MAWKVVLTPEAEAWREGLSVRDRKRIDKSIQGLEEHGPALGRPRVDSVKGSRHHNMKELRSLGGHLRALFAFDERRTAVVLLGGDKSNNWDRWYKENIRRADHLFDRHRRQLGGEGRWRSRGPRPGGRSGGVAL